MRDSLYSPPVPLSKLQEIESVLGEAIRGKPEVLRLSLACLLARGHLLIEDVPGVGKTTLAQALGADQHERLRQRPGPAVDGHLPFMVIATQNPVEHHGTYPLPESQLDRFLMRIKMGYPSHETEREILRRRTFDNPIETLEPVADVSEVLAMQESVTHVKVDASLHDYALEIVNRTRNSDQLALGVSPRGTLMLQRAAQARAFLEGRDYCVPDDFKQLAVSVFAHRVVASARHASLQKKSETTEAALREIVDSVRVPL